MLVTLIAAATAEWGIGVRGGLPWSIPDDLARFQRRTMGRTVIVGRRTATSLPRGLPGRRLLTVSSSSGFSSVDEALKDAMAWGEQETFVAGGAGVYLEALALATSAEITRVRGKWDCDVFMPDLAAAGWKLASIASERGLDIETWRP